jgi:hypothetical protein
VSYGTLERTISAMQVEYVKSHGRSDLQEDYGDFQNDFREFFPGLTAHSRDGLYSRSETDFKEMIL